MVITVLTTMVSISWVAPLFVWISRIDKNSISRKRFRDIRIGISSKIIKTIHQFVCQPTNFFGTFSSKIKCPLKNSLSTHILNIWVLHRCTLSSLKGTLFQFLNRSDLKERLRSVPSTHSCNGSFLWGIPNNCNDNCL